MKLGDYLTRWCQKNSLLSVVVGSACHVGIVGVYQSCIFDPGGSHGCLTVLTFKGSNLSPVCVCVEFAWVFCGCSGFLAHSTKNPRIIEFSKLSIGVNVIVNDCLSICPLRLSGDQPRILGHCSQPKSTGIGSSTPATQLGFK